MSTRIVIAAAMSIALMAGCKKSDADTQQAGVDAVATTEADQTTAAEQAEVTSEPAKPTAFDIEKYPVSDVALAEFPYFSLPEGYTNQNRGKFTKDFARFPFWVNGGAHWIEGKFYGTTFASVQGKDFSEYEFKRNFEALVDQMGGAKVSEGRVPNEEIKKWGDEITMGFLDGLGDLYNKPVTTYLVRRTDGNIWLHLVTTSAGGAYTIGHEQAFQPAAQPPSPPAEPEKE